MVVVMGVSVPGGVCATSQVVSNSVVRVETIALPVPSDSYRSFEPSVAVDPACADPGVHSLQRSLANL